jgi:hypothetical protein
MDSKQTRVEPDAHQERVVVVDPSRYAELLVSRRQLERVVDREGELHDRETHETFVPQVLPKEAHSARAAGR